MTALLLTAWGCTALRSSREQASVPPGPDGRAADDDRGLYSAQQALRDALSGPLEYVGTGRWPGVERSRACAFRNGRVVVVNAYCTLNETPALRVDVHSPQRGLVRFYVEAEGPVSARQRNDYFTFTVETSPVADRAVGLPRLTLAMGYEELRRYEQRRYDAYLPSCFGGEKSHRQVGGCLGQLQPRASEWAARNRVFLDRANDDWYRLVRELRILAGRYGTHPTD